MSLPVTRDSAMSQLARLPFPSCHYLPLYVLYVLTCCERGRFQGVHTILGYCPCAHLRQMWYKVSAPILQVCPRSVNLVLIVPTGWACYVPGSGYWPWPTPWKIFVSSHWVPSLSSLASFAHWPGFILDTSIPSSIYQLQVSPATLVDLKGGLSIHPPCPV